MINRHAFETDPAVINFFEEDYPDIKGLVSKEEVMTMLWKCYIEELGRECIDEPVIADTIATVRIQMTIPVQSITYKDILNKRASYLFFGNLAYACDLQKRFGKEDR